MGISRHPPQSERLEEIVSWMKGCRKYSSAGKNRLETHETQERKTLVGETEEEEK